MQYMLMCCFDETAWNNLPDAEEQDYERVWRLDTESRQHGPLPRRGKTPPGVVGEDCAHEERQDSTYRWTFRRDKRATRRLPPYRLRGSERSDVNRGPPSDASGRGHGRSALHRTIGVLILSAGNRGSESGIARSGIQELQNGWIPASAGMTARRDQLIREIRGHDTGIFRLLEI